MSDLGKQINFKHLLQHHKRIQIPLIQRDYAQGRPAAEEVRDAFLSALETALCRSDDDPSLPLNLDFIYGSVEGKEETRFLPLDGQQRLTTLFLLHWFLAWNDERWEDFTRLFQVNEEARFTYSVRQSSTEFFNRLVTYQPECRPEEVSQLSSLITNQPWYFRSWRLDPTVQSVLGMLDAIHNKFKKTEGFYERLTSEDKPAITFQLLDLDNFGLSDDLYIKMNARGKPLTPFETFKARYEQELEHQFAGETRSIDGHEFSIAEFVARRIDTTWADLFWAHRNTSTNLFDEAIMNLFRTVALVTRDPRNNSFVDNVIKLRNSIKLPSYSDFHSRDWLDQEFTKSLICLLEAWCNNNKKTTAWLLPDVRYFDEGAMFAKLVKSSADLSYEEVVQFGAYVMYISKHEDPLDPQAFQEWMRVVVNLSLNTYYDRPSDLQRSIAGLIGLIPDAKTILERFAKSDNITTGFLVQQIGEEQLKAQLILGHSGWRPLIDQAEEHGYFRGQIEFLLDFSGVMRERMINPVVNWDDSLHLSLQDEFKAYLQKAEMMFNDYGLVYLAEWRWQRALLSIGEYLLPSSRMNLSFLVNLSTDQASWKRLLRGSGPKVPEARKVLHQLWNHLNADQTIAPQLDKIITNATSIEPWRAALVQTPAAITYCEKQSIRWNSATEIYLLKKSQMNGSHAELFTFCLYHNFFIPLAKEGCLKPLALPSYYSVDNIEVEPGIRILYTHENVDLYFDIEFRDGKYVIFVYDEYLGKWPGLLPLLREQGFIELPNKVLKSASPAEIESKLLDFIQQISTALIAESLRT